MGSKTIMKKKTKPAKSSGFNQPQFVTHMHVRVPLSIANRIAKSNGGTVVLENNSEAYNVGDLIGFDVVEDIIGSLDTLHVICCDEGELYEITYVYSGTGIMPGYVLVQFRKYEESGES